MDFKCLTDMVNYECNRFLRFVPSERLLFILGKRVLARTQFDT